MKNQKMAIHKLSRFWLFFSLLPHVLLGQNESFCQKKPSFISLLGFNPQTTAISTVEKHRVGLALVQIKKVKPNQNSLQEIEKGKVYQHPTWQMGGNLGGFVFDHKGNMFLVPTPFISILNNPIELQNRIYQVDGKTGIMKVWKELSISNFDGQGNPYGLTGLAFSCEDSSLFVSTLMGSTRQKVNGIIYHLNLETKEIIDSITGMDALGLGVSITSGTNQLYFGDARTSKIFSIEILPSGKFKKETLQEVISLEDLGARGDDKARKIKFVNGLMLVTGLEFNFTLQANNELPETYYSFEWITSVKKWKLKSIQ